MLVSSRANLLLKRPANLCPTCLFRLSTSSSTPRRSVSSDASLESARQKQRSRSSPLSSYFSANGFPDSARGVVFYYAWKHLLRKRTIAEAKSSFMTVQRCQTSTSTVAQILRKNSPVKDLPEKGSQSHAYPIPHDASSRLSNHARSLPPTSLRRLFTTYLSLSKPRLTFLMVLTTASAYSLYPVPSVLLPAATDSPSLSALTLVFLTAGTGLCSAAANSLNMMMEPQHDAKMSRTRNRPLVRGLIGRRGALLFAIATGTCGVVGLYMGVNPTVSFLGALNIFLYAGVYTPLKRISVLNTWVGAVVGGIPPLMGWAAAAGQNATGAGDWKELLLEADAAGGWLLATLLFAWQFHHFNALSWTVRNEYKYAGYRMLAWVNEAMNARVALRYALLCVPVCWGLSAVGVTDWGFVVTSSVVNAWIIREAWKFYKLKGKRGSARGLFWAGVWQLPILMVLAMAQKKGLWEGLWRRIVGDDNDEIWVEDEDYVQIT